MCLTVFFYVMFPHNHFCNMERLACCCCTVRWKNRVHLQIDCRPKTNYLLLIGSMAGAAHDHIFCWDKMTLKKQVILIHVNFSSLTNSIKTNHNLMLSQCHFAVVFRFSVLLYQWTAVQMTVLHISMYFHFWKIKEEGCPGTDWRTHICVQGSLNTWLPETSYSIDCGTAVVHGPWSPENWWKGLRKD